MATPHICQVDCHVEPIMHEGEQVGSAHVMYPTEPSSAAGRYQWEQNRAILDAGRRAWRASGQGQSRECRAWDDKRRRKLEWIGQSGMFRIRSFARLRLALAAS